MRDGHLVEIDSREIVPGDLVIVEAGDKVPADLDLVVAEQVVGVGPVDNFYRTARLVIVHQFPDRDRQSTQCHRVDARAEELQREHGDDE